MKIRTGFMMNRCDGWESLSHSTDDPIAVVYLSGCPYCGGADCFDTGDTIYLCPTCLEELRGDTSMIDRYRIDE